MILVVVFSPDSTSLGLARQFTLQAAETVATLASQASAAPIETQQREATEAMDDIFLQGVDDALGDLFG
ncbi:MAG: hypothetical protein U9R15_06585 [Chloroflexota bacterium]|nr:hypothetical protein [Chloroflexota bacterium]